MRWAGKGTSRANQGCRFGVHVRLLRLPDATGQCQYDKKVLTLAPLQAAPAGPGAVQAIWRPHLR